MEIWLDSVGSDLIKKAKRTGILHGVTTNPAILRESHLPPEETLCELLAIQEGPITAQVAAETVEEMIKEGQTFHKISTRIIVKVPVTEEGIEVIHALSKAGIPVMATVIFHAHQVLLAAKAGAEYAAPYFSRMGDEAKAEAELELMQRVGRQYGVKVLVASLRTLEHIAMCMRLGVAAVTVKEGLFRELVATSESTAKIVEHFRVVGR